MRFFSTPHIIQTLFSQLHWHLTRKEPTIYLTFDDGPSPELSQFILDCLAHYKARATFFCVGANIEKYHEIFQKIIEQGHQIGNHTFHHLNGWKTNSSTYLQDIEECQSAINKYFTTIQPVFRPPYGKINFKALRTIKNQYKIVMWDVLSYDFDQKLNRKKALDQLLKVSRSGSVVVFHDNVKAMDNLKYLLPRFLAHFFEKGYKFKSIS